MLRERFAHRYNRTLFGMYPRNRRGEPSRRGESIGSSLERLGGIVPRRNIGGKMIEADGAPLVDTEALNAMIRVLRIVQVVVKQYLFIYLFILCFILLYDLYSKLMDLNRCSHCIRAGCKGFC